MMENQYDSPEHTNKMMYSHESHSGRKIKDMMGSPFHRNAIAHHTLLSNKKASLLYKKEHHRAIPVPQVLRE